MASIALSSTVIPLPVAERVLDGEPLLDENVADELSLSRETGGEQ